MKKSGFHKIIPVISLLCLILSGCYDYTEPNDLSFVVAVGIDEGQENGLYNFTLQFARPAQISGGSNEEGGSGKETISTISVEAPSIYAAMNTANHIISKTFTLSHTKIIVISDTIAKNGINSIVDAAGRSSDIRPSVFLCVSQGKAQDYLKSVKPVVEINPVKYYRLIFESPKSSYTPKNDVGTVYFNLKSDTQQNTLPLVGVGKGTEKNQQSNNQNEQQGGGQSSDSQESSQQSLAPEASQNQTDKKIPVNESEFEYKIKKYTAGNLDIEKQNASEVIGSAVFKGDKMTASLSGIESEMLNILCGRYTNGYSVIYSKKTPNDPVTIRMEQLKKPKIKINLDSANPKIYIKLFLEGNFVSVPSEYIIEKEISEFEEDTAHYIEQSAIEFLNRTAAEFDSDIIGFGKAAKGLFLSIDDYNKCRWNEIYKNAEFDCEVEFSIRRTGLTVRSSDENER